MAKKNEKKRQQTRVQPTAEGKIAALSFFHFFFLFFFRCAPLPVRYIVHRDNRRITKSLR